MSQENVEIVRRGFDAWNRRDAETLVGLCHPEVEIHAFVASLRGEPYRGHAGLREWLSDVQDSFEDFTPTLRETQTHGDYVVGFGVIRWRGKDSGAELEQPVAWVLRLRDGKLLRLQMFRDRVAALEAAGLSE